MFAGWVNKRLDTAEERFAELENRSREMIRTQKLRYMFKKKIVLQCPGYY